MNSETYHKRPVGVKAPPAGSSPEPEDRDLPEFETVDVPGHVVQAVVTKALVDSLGIGDKRPTFRLDPDQLREILAAIAGLMPKEIVAKPTPAGPLCTCGSSAGCVLHPPRQEPTTAGEGPMRWTDSGTGVRAGSRRNKSGFLLIPKQIGGEFRWLEFAAWEEEFTLSVRRPAYWNPIRWLDTSAGEAAK